MLNARENMEEVINHGCPDRYVNNYEGINLMFSPIDTLYPAIEQGGDPIKDAWGITYIWPEGTPAEFPMHDEEHLVLKDIEDWRDYVKAPRTKFSDAEWDPFRQMYADFDRSNCLCATFYAPGLWEMSHHLGSITEMLINLVMYTDEYRDLIKYIEEFELKIAEGICENLHPDAIFHHDDWGSESNSFMSPDIFDEVFLEPYKNIYKYYKDHGVKYVFHHADSYAANLVPEMVEIGIDVWQGPMHANDIPALVKQYGDKITFMGNIDNKFVDFEGWTRESCHDALIKCIEEDGLGPNSYIPCITQGGPGSTVPGVYLSLVEELDKYNSEKFGFSLEEIQAARQPLQMLF